MPYTLVTAATRFADGWRDGISHERMQTMYTRLREAISRQRLARLPKKLPSSNIGRVTEESCSHRMLQMLRDADYNIRELRDACGSNAYRDIKRLSTAKKVHISGYDIVNAVHWADDVPEYVPRYRLGPGRNRPRPPATKGIVK